MSPKYVFGTSVKLPSGQVLDTVQLTAIAVATAIYVRNLARAFNTEAGDALYDDPYEHVFGAWAEPDAEGVTRPSTTSSPIDLRPEHFDHVGSAEQAERTAEAAEDKQ